MSKTKNSFVMTSVFPSGMAVKCSGLLDVRYAPDFSIFFGCNERTAVCDESLSMMEPRSLLRTAGA